MSISQRYLFFGISFGLLFPVIASFLCAFQFYGAISFNYITHVQSENSLLWIIDSAPVFLGILAFIAGLNREREHIVNEKLSKQVRDQKVGLTAVNSALKKELEIGKRRERDLHQAQKEAIQGIQVKEQFLSNMSHEIRTPMNGILGLTKLLLSTELTPVQKKYLSAIDYSAGNLLVIINDILDLSKINAEKIEFDKVDFSLEEVIKSVDNTLKIKASEKGIVFKMMMDNNIPELMSGDPVRLGQIILNIAGNAVKFTEKGSVVVGCRLLESNKIGHKIEVVVKDTGIGIDQSRIDTIFESFSQGGARITNKYGGTGLGLPISKKLIELQGGELHVASTGGEGSIFTFSIQYGLAERVKDSKHEAEKIELPINDGSNVKILLAEDNHINQLVAKSFLDRFGFTTTIVDNGLKAIEALRNEAFDLVIMDVQMPEMNGLEATMYIRTKLKGPNKDVKIIAMTASVMKGDIDKCFKAGMDDYLPKPFDPNELFKKVNLLTKSAA